MNEEGDEDSLSVPGMQEILARNLRDGLLEDEPAVGLLVDGTWRLIADLGSGGFGRVFKGWHVNLKSPFALKFLTSTRTEAKVAFLEEARLLARLPPCENLVQVSHCGALPAGTPYLVMDFLQGQTLRDRIETPPRLLLRDTLAIIDAVLAGLAHVHERDVLHCDVKPSNIFLETAGVRLLDFGLARSLSLTNDHAIGGTPPYMAPELLLDGVAPGPHSDLYAVGVVLHEMLTGELPRGFLQMNFTQALEELRDAPARTLRFFRPDLPEELSLLVDQLLALDPSSRPLSARVARKRAQAIAANAKIEVKMPSHGQQSRRFTTVGDSLDDGLDRTQGTAVVKRVTERERVAIRDIRPASDRTMCGVPPPPKLFLGRAGDLDELKERLGIGADNEPVGVLSSCGASVAALRGWAGVGKTALATVLALDSDIAAAFPGGVLWATLGPKPRMAKIFSAWGDRLGLSGLLRIPSLSDIAETIRRALQREQYLLIVDDVLEKEHVEVFRRACPLGSTLLVATRELGALSHLEVNERAVYRLPVLSVDDSVDLLGRLAPRAVEENREGCRRLVQALECLPLALHVAGRLLKEEEQVGLDPTTLLNGLEREAMSSNPGGSVLLSSKTPLDRMNIDDQVTPSVAALLHASTARLSARDRERFAYLGPVAPRPATFDLDTIKNAWICDDPWPTIKALVARGLLEVTQSPRRHGHSFQMHALLIMHARSLLR